MGEGQAPAFEVDKLGSPSQSAPETFQLGAGSAGDVGAPVGLKGPLGGGSLKQVTLW